MELEDIVEGDLDIEIPQIRSELTRDPLLDLRPVAVGLHILLLYFTARARPALADVKRNYASVASLLAFYSNKVSVYEPSFRVVVVELIEKIENLLPHQRIIPVYVHHNIPRSAMISGGRVPVPQSPYWLLVSDYSYSIIQTGIFMELGKYHIS